MQDAVVVGAGIAGLSAAWALRDHDIVVLEAGSRIGGRIRSERRGDYWLNLGAHVFGGADTATGRLMAEAGVASEPVPGVLTAVSMQRQLVASGPVESYPFRLPLSFSDRVAAIRSGFKLRRAVARYDRAARPRKGEHQNARRDRMLAFLGDETFSSFIGHLPAGVEALYRPTITRSSAELDELAAGHGVGYFHLVWRKSEGLSRNVLGGSSMFTDALARPLGDRVLTDAPVREVTQHKDRVVVRFRRGDREDEIEARAVVLATPAYVTATVAKALPVETRSALESIPYGPYVVVAFLTSEPEATRWDGLYAIATPGRAFNMVFNLANVVRGRGARRPGGSLMLYSGGRRLAAPLLKLTDEEIVERYLMDLDEVFPEARSMVVETIVQRWPRALPYGLLPVHVEAWGCLVLVNLDPQAQPLSEWIGDLPVRLSGYDLAEWSIQRHKTYHFRANWKLVAENFMEYYHLPWVHPELIKVSRVEDHYRYQGPGMYTGMTTSPVSPNTETGGWLALPPKKGLNAADAVSARFIWLFPNVAISVLPNHVFIMMVTPEGPAHTVEETYVLSHADSMTPPGAEGELDNLAGFWDRVNQQDIWIVERVQAGLAESAAYTGGRMCYRFEEPIHRFQNMVIDRMVGVARVPPGDLTESAPVPAGAQ